MNKIAVYSIITPFLIFKLLIINSQRWTLALFRAFVLIAKSLIAQTLKNSVIGSEKRKRNIVQIFAHS